MSNYRLYSEKNLYNAGMKKKGFTLIEVLVATTLASVVLIGTFFLLQGSFRQSQTILESPEFEEVFLNTRNCILTEDMNSLSGSVKSVTYSSSGCVIQPYVSDFSFTWISIGRLHADVPTVKKTYYSYFSVSPGTWSGRFMVEHTLVNELQRRTRTYEVFQ